MPRLPHWIRLVAPNSVAAPRDVVRLYRGEIEAAIAVALEIQASPLIPDDLPSRRHAISVRLAFIGTAGVLVMAKGSNLNPTVYEPLDALWQNGLRLRQDLYEQILLDTGKHEHRE